MSAEPAGIRRQLSQVRAYLKQGKPLPAAQIVQSALQVLQKGQLLKAERQELERMLEEAVSCLANDESIRKIYPLRLAYAPGRESELDENVRGLLEAFDALAAEEAQERLRLREERKRALLAQGKEEFARAETGKGLHTFAALDREFPDDPRLRGEMGTVLLEARQYAAAVKYLEDALEMHPDFLPLYNMIGIALRKLERFENAEHYYLQALERVRDDSALYFNLGRLYVDWEKWGKAAKAGRTALDLNPGFDEARMLLAYAEKKLEERGAAS
jgi:tetratricopeptide (TPR) repeat protein